MLATHLAIMLWAYTALLFTSFLGNGLAQPVTVNAASTITEAMPLIKRAVKYTALPKPAAAAKASQGMLSKLSFTKSKSVSKAMTKGSAPRELRTSTSSPLLSSPSSSHSLSSSSSISRSSSSSSSSSSAHSSPSISTTTSPAGSRHASPARMAASQAHQPSGSPHSSPANTVPAKPSSKLKKDNKWVNNVYGKNTQAAQAFNREENLILRGHNSWDRKAKAETNVQHYRSKMLDTGRSLDTMGGKIKSIIPGTLEHKVASNTRQVRKENKKLAVLQKDIQYQQANGEIKDVDRVHKTIDEFKHDYRQSHASDRMEKTAAKSAPPTPQKSFKVPSPGTFNNPAWRHKDNRGVF